MSREKKALKVAFKDDVLYQEYKKMELTDYELYKKISKAVEKLKADCFCGIQIKKNLIPKEYDVKNLWKINLGRSWRLVYTIAQDEIIIYSIILEWFNHKEYERRFKF